MPRTPALSTLALSSCPVCASPNTIHPPLLALGSGAPDVGSSRPEASTISPQGSAAWVRLIGGVQAESSTAGAIELIADRIAGTRRGLNDMGVPQGERVDARAVLVELLLEPERVSRGAGGARGGRCLDECGGGGHLRLVRPHEKPPQCEGEHRDRQERDAGVERDAHAAEYWHRGLDAGLDVAEHSHGWAAGACCEVVAAAIAVPPTPASTTIASPK